jgi:hypothetical protein
MAHLIAFSALLFGAIALASDVHAGPSIESDSFRLVLPDGWATDPQARPPAIKGPKGEIFQLSSTTAPATRSTEEAQPLIREAERRAVAIITKIAQNPSFVTVQPLSSQRLVDGSVLHQIVSATNDGKRLLAQYVVAGPRTVLFATLDLLQTDAPAIDAIASMLRDVQWRQ